MRTIPKFLWQKILIMKQDITLDIALLYCYGFLGYIWFDLGLRPSEELMRKCIH